jgi:DNA-binding CsgD family transcriptional regulator
MRQAAEVSIRLALSHTSGMTDAFEAIGCASVLIDCLGKVRRISPLAERHIGSTLQLAQGQLSASHKESDHALQRLIADLLRPPQINRRPQVLAIIERPDHRPLIAYGMPVTRSAQDVFQYGKALLILVDPDEHLNPSALILRQGFKLTQTETRLAIALAQGCTLDDYAGKHRVSIGTVRFQLKSVMAKTSTHRQAELVSFLGQLSQALPVKR